MADQNGTPRAPAPQSPNGRSAAQVREGLAAGKKHAQLQLADGTPVSGWLTAPEAFDAAVTQALKTHARDEIRIRLEEAL